MAEKTKRGYEKWTAEQKNALIQCVRHQYYTSTKNAISWTAVEQRMQCKSSRQCYDEWLRIKRELSAILGVRLGLDQAQDLMQILTIYDVRKFSETHGVSESSIKKCLRLLSIRLIDTSCSRQLAAENDSKIHSLSSLSSELLSGPSFPAKTLQQPNEETKTLLQQLRSLCNVMHVDVQ